VVKINDSPPPPPLRARKKEAQAKALYHAALKLFRRDGYEATTVQHIADAAGASKGTFFNYYATKEHILAEYQRRMGDEVLGSLASRRFRSTRSAVRAALRQCATYALDDPRMGRVIVKAFFSSDLLMDADQVNEAGLVEWMARQVADGMERGEIRADVDVPTFLSLVVGTLSATMLEWVTGDRAFDIEGVLDRKVDLLFDGVARRTDKGKLSRRRSL